MKKGFNILHHSLFVITIALSVFSVLAVVYCLANLLVNYSLDTSKDGFYFLVSSFAPYKTLFELTILSVTACVALHAYLNNCKVNAAKLLLEIRQLLNTEKNKKIHKALENENNEVNAYLKKDKLCDLYNYLGILETLNILLKNDVVEFGDFKNQFGYRIENIKQCSAVMEQVNKDHKYWQDLLELMDKIENK